VGVRHITLPEEMRQQKAEIEQLRRDVSQKEAAAARFQEARLAVWQLGCL